MTETRQKLKSMLELQGQMNTRVHSHWKDQNYPWYRAIWTEAAELLEHYGWKWWKKQIPDTDQVILELIDIWHFGLSDFLQRSDDLDAVAAELETSMKHEAHAAEFKDCIEAFASSVLLNRRFDAAGFAKLLVGAGLQFDELYKNYVAKNVLNLFRQDHGYKEGTYHKTWDGREDNEHLVEMLRLMDSESLTFKDDLYKALQGRYKQTHSRAQLQ